MSATPLGETTPPGLFDERPKLIIYDPDDFLATNNVQLNPFGAIVLIKKNEIDLNKLIDTNSRRTLVVILIFPNQSRDVVKTFVRTHLFQQQSIHSIILFFTNGQNHAIDVQNSFASLTIQCNSITVHLAWDIRDVLATAFYLIVQFYGRRMREEKTLGNNGLAFIYEREYGTSVRLQNDYARSILHQIEKD